MRFEKDLSGTIERGCIHTLPDPRKSQPVPAPYDHQLVTLRRLEQGTTLTPPLSGIVHLPTGAGKTRVALEYVARTLATEPPHRFLWATNSKLLIEQTMTKAFEYAALFPRGTRIAWYDGDPELLENDGVHVMFLTAAHLRQEMKVAHDQRSRHPWRDRASAGQPLTLIYDECHQLGGDELQIQLLSFYEKVLIPSRKNRWRLIGLSATPIPTSLDAQEVLRVALFPQHPSMRSAASDWGMHVFHRVDNKELIRAGVLCPVNMYFDRRGIFDIPPHTLRRLIGEANIKAPGPNARRDDVLKYAMKFDRDVMGSDAVVRFLAEKLARNLDAIGKTVVFVPNIQTANRFVEELNRFPNCAGKVAAVHSKMSELPVPGQAARTPQQILEEFKQREARPCILVNVEMLTEGFDDPLVRTVVLAKLTLSTNRFWQMIGRGTRGPRAKGTTDCFVIDPVKLTRLYDYFAGYQPTVGSRPGAAIDDEPEEQGPGALDPNVPAVSRPPLPSSVRYEVSEDLRRTHASVAHAIEQFLAGGSLGEREAIDIAHSVSIAAEDGAVMARPGPAADSAETGQVLLLETLERMKARMSNDLAWLYRQLPGETSDDVLRYWIRKLHAVERLGLRTMRNTRGQKWTADLPVSCRRRL